MLFSPSEEGNTMFFNLGSYSMGFFFPLSRVLMDFDKNKNMLYIRYLESFDIYEKSKKNGKVKEVSLKVLDSEKSEEFFKVFSLIFKEISSFFA